MDDRGVEPDVHCYNFALSACDKTSRWREALSLLETMGERDVTPNIVSYNCAISVCTKGTPAQWTRALELLREMDIHDLSPDAWTYHSTFDVCRKAHWWTVADQLLTRMEADKPRTPANNAVLRGGLGSDWQKTVAMLETMEKETEIAPKVVNYNLAICACEKAMQWQAALELLEVMERRGVKPNKFSYTHAMAAWEAGYSAASDLATSMETIPQMRASLAKMSGQESRTQRRRSARLGTLSAQREKLAAEEQASERSRSRQGRSRSRQGKREQEQEQEPEQASARSRRAGGEAGAEPESARAGVLERRRRSVRRSAPVVLGMEDAQGMANLAAKLSVAEVLDAVKNVLERPPEQRVRGEAGEPVARVLPPHPSTAALPSVKAELPVCSSTASLNSYRHADDEVDAAKAAMMSGGSATSTLARSEALSSLADPLDTKSRPSQQSALVPRQPSRAATLTREPSRAATFAPRRLSRAATLIPRQLSRASTLAPAEPSRPKEGRRPRPVQQRSETLALPARPSKLAPSRSATTTLTPPARKPSKLAPSRSATLTPQHVPALPTVGGSHPAQPVQPDDARFDSANPFHQPEARRGLDSFW